MRQVYTCAILPPDASYYFAPVVQFVSQLADAIRSVMVDWLYSRHTPVFMSNQFFSAPSGFR